MTRIIASIVVVTLAAFPELSIAEDAVQDRAEMSKSDGAGVAEQGPLGNAKSAEHELAIAMVANTNCDLKKTDGTVTTIKETFESIVNSSEELKARAQRGDIEAAQMLPYIPVYTGRSWEATQINGDIWKVEYWESQVQPVVQTIHYFWLADIHKLRIRPLTPVCLKLVSKNDYKKYTATMNVDVNQELSIIPWDWYQLKELQNARYGVVQKATTAVRKTPPLKK